jgi:1D-myo-inositol 3-kinase
VYYAANTAARLGYSVGVVTAGAAEVECLRALPNTVVISLDAKKSTSFENLYEGGVRRQLLRARAPIIPVDLVPPEWSNARAVLLAPVADEVPIAMSRAFPQSLVGVAAQGYMRRLIPGEEVRRQPWNRALEVLPHVAAAIFSEEDVQGQVISWLGYRGPVLAMTRGALGCDLIHCGKRRAVRGFPVQELDPTGAGDVFAAAFMLELARLREPVAAARYANAVASFSVTGRGAEALPTSEQAQERLAVWKSS